MSNIGGQVPIQHGFPVEDIRSILEVIEFVSPVSLNEQQQIKYFETYSRLVNLAEQLEAAKSAEPQAAKLPEQSETAKQPEVGPRKQCAVPPKQITVPPKQSAVPPKPIAVPPKPIAVPQKQSAAPPRQYTGLPIEHDDIATLLDVLGEIMDGKDISKELVSLIDGLLTYMEKKLFEE